MGVLLANNASSTLSTSMSPVSTTLSVKAGEGALFPVIGGASDWFPLTCIKQDGRIEIMRCTARTGDVMTVERAQEGTPAIAWSALERVDLRLTAAVIEELNANVQAAVDDAAGYIADTEQNTADIALLNQLRQGSTDPGAVGAYALWADTGTGYLMQRNAANTGWIRKWKLTADFIDVIRDQTFTGYTSAGSDPNFTVATVPPATAYTAGRRLRVKFNAGSTSPTLNMDGLGAKNVKQYDSTGAKMTALVATDMLADLEYDGTDWVLLNRLAPSAAVTTPVRQTVLSGSVDASGFANFLSVGTGLSVNVAATTTAITLAFAAGYSSIGAVDYIGRITADTTISSGIVGSQTISSITRVTTTATLTTAAPHGLSTGAIVTISGATSSVYNGTYTITVTSATTFTYVMASDPGGSASVVGSYTVTNFLYADRNTSTGAITLASTILPPTYVYTAASTTSGQHTFRISDMQMYLGNGTTAPAVQRVFLGEALASSATISSVITYALRGEWYSTWQSYTAGSTLTQSHNIGVLPQLMAGWISNKSDGICVATTDYIVPMATTGYSNTSGTGSKGYWMDRNGHKFRATSNLAYFNDVSGATIATDTAYIRFKLSRGF